MTPELARTLQPLQDAVHAAQTALDAHNRAADANPLDGLHHAGHLIHTQQQLIARTIDLLSAIGADPETVQMQIQGRIRALESRGK